MIAISVVIIGVAVWLIQMSRQTQSSVQVPDQKAQQAQVHPVISQEKGQGETPAKKQTGIVYSNPQFGFQLTFPSGWEKYTTEMWSKPSDSVSEIAFLLPTSDPEWLKSGQKTGMVFIISAIPVAEFPIIERECEKENGKNSSLCYINSNKIGQNNKYVFYCLRADKSTDYPKDFSENLFNQVDNIVKTFKAIG